MCYGEINHEKKFKYIHLCEKAAELKSLNAMDELGWIYSYLKKDYKKAIPYFLFAAERNFELSRYRLANCYFDMKDYDNAIYWHKQSMNDYHPHCQLAKCYMKKAELVPSDLELKEKNLILARRICVDGFFDIGCELCSEFLIDSFHLLDKCKMTREEVNNMCDYYHNYGIKLVSDEKLVKKRELLDKLEKFYIDYFDVIDFDEEYRKILLMISVGVKAKRDDNKGGGKNISGGNTSGEKNISGGKNGNRVDDDKADDFNIDEENSTNDPDGEDVDFKKYNFDWAKDVLLLLIRRPECIFHYYASNYNPDKIKLFTKRIEEYCSLPFVLSDICSLYLFSVPDYIMDNYVIDR